jgi:hypothetical protein
MAEDERDLLRELRDGRVHAFSAFHEVEQLPRTGAGVYTIWDGNDNLVYVGIAGRNLTGKGLHGRLKSHYQGRRSGDQFCVYVGDRYVLGELSGAQRAAIVNGQLSMDQLIRDYIRAHFSFRHIETSDYATAMRVEIAIKQGAFGKPPRLNP